MSHSNFCVNTPHEKNNVPATYLSVLLIAILLRDVYCFSHADCERRIFTHWLDEMVIDFVMISGKWPASDPSRLPSTATNWLSSILPLMFWCLTHERKSDCGVFFLQLKYMILKVWHMKILALWHNLNSRNSNRI